MQTKYLTVADDLKVKVWAYNDAFPEGDTFIGEFVHEEALDPFGMVLYPKLQEFALKRLRDLVEDPATVNINTVELVQAYGDNFVKADEVVEPATPVPEEPVVEPTEEEEKGKELEEEPQEEDPDQEEEQK